jgi:light-regulated signal transduction histidine kinase (bacteriophytochrome)
VLSDVMMPRLDGFGLLAALRAMPATRTLPVILLSARAGAEASVEGIDAGADDYLSKPFIARELIARVRTHVALNHTRRAWSLQLERANKELEAFSYSVSHDLRAPLRAIDGFCKILLGDHAHALDPEGVDSLHQIHDAARRMASIVDDLLVLSKVGQVELRRHPIDVTAIARRVVADLRLRSPARVVDVRIADGLVAHGDDRMVTILLENLLANAWKFTGKCSDATIRVGQEDGGVVFVRDNGAGFDMAFADRLFEPFQRLHADSEFEGTGIGLAIVRRIVDRHGGRAWAHGAVGDGAIMRFTLGGEPVGGGELARLR